jgi:hypothetical protein
MLTPDKGLPHCASGFGRIKAEYDARSFAPHTLLPLSKFYFRALHFTLLFCYTSKGLLSSILAAGSRLLALPRELRDQIYGYYFSSEDGYTLEYDTGKLTTSTPNMNRIELDLRLTCSQVAFETRGLPFQLNTIHFFTVYRDRFRETLGRFSTTLVAQLIHRAQCLAICLEAGCGDVAIFSKIKPDYPQFSPVAQSFQERGQITGTHSGNWKGVPSAGRQFVASVLKRMATQPEYAVRLATLPDWAPRTADPVPNVSLWYDPWIIPTEDDVSKLIQSVPSRFLDADYQSNPHQYFDKQKYRLSAASVAIKFLRSLRSSTRLQLRKLILHENHVSIAWPESHAQGLIPYCKENSRLRIERRVDLWRNAFPAGSAPLLRVVQSHTGEYGFGALLDTLHSASVSRFSIAPWVMEALALPDLGMPKGAFKLVLHDDHMLETTSEIFDIVMQDAVYQAAFEICMARNDYGNASWDWLKMREHGTYIMDGFPKAMFKIARKESLVEFNFDLGWEYGPNLMAERRANWSWWDWYEDDVLRHVVTFETEAPLPSWLELRLEDLLPDPGDLTSSNW